MPRYAYERLSAQDNSFLLAEGPHTPMHIAAAQILETGDLGTEDGGIDIRRYKRAIESVLHLIPRYRQKLQWIPFENRPVWVDDRHFYLDYHIRHSSLPRPGSLVQLKQLCARIMSHQLDRSRPLWEIWLVEGLAGGEQFAIISKIHHCMLDGTATADLAQVLMSPSQSPELADPLPYIPRPAPSGRELVRDEWLQRLNMPLRAARALRGFVAETDDLVADLRQRARALQDLARVGMRSAPPTPINGRVGPHRRFDWLTMPLDDVKEVRAALGCTVNDLVLATVAGAVRRYLLRRRVDPAMIDFRVATPVSVRRDSQRGAMGNQVSTWVVPLPIATEDPRQRLTALSETTRELKKSNSAGGLAMLMAAAEWAPQALLALGTRAASGPVNMIVTNVPGPQFPLYLLGAKLLATYPLVPLLPNTGLGVALFSYDGKLCWGFNADYELVPDLPTFVELIVESFEELRAVAAATVVAPRRKAKVERDLPVRDAPGQAMPSGSTPASRRRRRARPRSAATASKQRSRKSARSP